MNSSKPLDNFPLVRSRNPEEVCAALARVYARPVLVPARGVDVLDSIFNHCRLKNFELSYGTFGASVGLEFPETDFFSLLIPIGGCGEVVRGQTSLALQAGAGAMISAGVGHRTNCSADYEHFVLRISARALHEKLAAMTDAPISEPLRMHPQQNPGYPAAQMLQQYVPLLVDTLNEAPLPFPDWWIAQTEQLLMTLILCGHKHNYSHLLERDAADAAPREVREAEEYLEANAQRAVSLEELAEVTGTSALRLFSAFKKHRGYSPLTFLSQVRARRRGTTK